MKIIIDTEDQDWRSNNGITPTDEELANKAQQFMCADWIRVYRQTKTDSK